MSTDTAGWRQSLQSRQLSSVNELKGVAILLVIAYHTQLAVGWVNWSQGQIGVDIFLVISGWLIGRSLTPELTLRDFFWRRIWRIVPAYWIVLIGLCLFKCQVLHGAFDLPGTVAHLFGLQIFGPDEWFFGINPSFWFISLLLLTYPLAFFLRAERSPAKLLSVGLALGVASCWLGMLVEHHAFVVNVPARLISFCAGLAIAAALRDNVDFRKDRGMFFALLALCGYMEMGGVPLLRPCIYAFALMAVYLALRGSIAGQPRRSFPYGPLAFLGFISYELFLLHQPLLRMALHAFPSLTQSDAGPLISALIGIVVSIALAWVSSSHDRDDVSPEEKARDAIARRHCLNLNRLCI
ncbi:MAG: acyltransferase [Nibricoccus sp.]